MKLTDYIAQNHASISEYARVNGYHETQVKRCIAKGGLIDEDGKPYYKRYINKSTRKLISI